MSRPDALALTAALALLAGLSAAPAALAQQAPASSATSSPPVVNVTQLRDDHLNHDKWAKTAPATPTHHGSGDDSEDEDSGGDSSKHVSHHSPHYHELNGKLHLGDW